jgi:L-lactate dehydrogenase complex protein LldG
MTARDDIMSRIRRAQQVSGPRPALHRAAPDRHLAAHARGPAISRTALDQAGLVELFLAEAGRAAASVERLASFRDVPGALVDFLARENLPARVVMAPDPALDEVPWADRPLLTIRRGPSDGNDLVSVTAAFAAVAETGTLMLTSGPDHPTTLNFLPETHVVVLRRDQVVAGLEDGFDRLRARGAIPRAVNLVTGPSRSADIGQELQLGAHGPRRLHILLVDDGERPA